MRTEHAVAIALTRLGSMGVKDKSKLHGVSDETVRIYTDLFAKAMDTKYGSRKYASAHIPA